MPDLLRLSIHSQDEVLDPEIANGMARTIHYLGIDTSHRDIATKGNGRVTVGRGSDSRLVKQA
jgi:hypothetical protein